MEIGNLTHTAERNSKSRLVTKNPQRLQSRLVSNSMRPTTIDGTGPERKQCRTYCLQEEELPEAVIKTLLTVHSEVHKLRPGALEVSRWNSLFLEWPSNNFVPQCRRY